MYLFALGTFLFGLVLTVVGFSLIFASLLYFGMEEARGKPVSEGEAIGKLLAIQTSVGLLLVILHNVWIAFSSAEQRRRNANEIQLLMYGTLAFLIGLPMLYWGAKAIGA